MGVAEGLSDTPTRKVFVEEVLTPVVRVTPDVLQFQLTINNQMSRVFRGSGAVVQVNFGTNLQQLDPTAYSELTNLILPPRSERQIQISGPKIDSIPVGSTIGLFVYDVVTKTDNAGNILEKQNYEWYYDYRTDIREITGEVQRKRGWIDSQ